MASEQSPATTAPVESTAPAPVLGEDGQPLSKGEIKRRAKEAESGCLVVLFGFLSLSMTDGWWDLRLCDIRSS